MCTLAVGFGGFVWAWQLKRTENFYAPWLSHAIVDVAVYIIGYDLVFGQA